MTKNVRILTPKLFYIENIYYICTKYGTPKFYKLWPSYKLHQESSERNRKISLT